MVPAEGELLDLALTWWGVHMRRPIDNITSVGLDGRAVLHFTWEGEDGPMPYDLPLIDLHRWSITGVRTTARSL